MPGLGNLQGNVFAQLAAAALVLVTILVARHTVGKKAKRPPVLNREWQTFKLKEKIEVSPNTAIYRFALPFEDDVLGLPIGQHIQVRAKINGKDFTRKYTPTSSDDDLGHFDLMIKSYDQGNISKWFTTLKIGDSVDIKGPNGQMQYSPSLVKEIGMIAGGTGITPMLQIIRAAMKNPLDQTEIKLIYANVNLSDILLKKELDDLAEAHRDRFHLFYVLNNAPENWEGGVGFVTKDHIEQHIPKTHSNMKVLMCGPPPMMNAMKPHLEKLGYPPGKTISKLEDQVFYF